ncbi:MAG: hypothetical protein M1814_006467 [Vezdaea aestivalis]|nr:MAG: hypothetical protein M1814_006467 [Vezdaea aestivalis]
MTMVEEIGSGHAPEPDTHAPGASDVPAPHPALSDHCVTDRPLPSGESPTGEVSDLGGIDVYISKPSDYPNQPAKLLLLLTNGVGIKSKNNQLQADKFAGEGFLVLMPDLFGGDTLTAPNTATAPAADSEDLTSTIEQIKLRATAVVTQTAKAFAIDMWLARNTPEKVIPILEKVIAEAKGEFADAISFGGGIYAVGYCFGGKFVLSLCGRPSNQQHIPKDIEEGVLAEESPLVKAGALAHGTLVTIEDIQGVISPVSLICINDDQLFPDEVREEGVKFLKENKIPHEVEIYPNVPHGFAVLGQYEDRAIQEAQNRAFDRMLAWIKAH